MERTWHYRSGADEEGPVSTDELRRLVGIGRLAGSSFVRSDADTTWRPAGLCAELRDAFAPPLPPPPPSAPTLWTKPIWLWVLAAGAVLMLPNAVVILLALLGGSERSHNAETMSPQVDAGVATEAVQQGAESPLAIGGEDATEELIQMMAEMTAEQRTAIGMHYLATGQDFYGARIRITNRSNAPVWVRPENIRLHFQGKTFGVSSGRDSRFLQVTLLEPRRYIEGLVVYRAEANAGAGMRLGSGRISYLVDDGEGSY